MTDRWRVALRDLDDLGPDESVYRRARQGPSHPETPDGPGRAKRLVAGVTAVAVFALAAGFAWRALRPTGESVAVAPAPGSVVALGEDGSTLWPENTAAGLKASQAEADAGNLAWRLDPEEVATRFANQVLGWNPGNYGVDTTVTTSRQGSVTGVTARLTRYALPCPAPVNGHMGPMCAGGAEDIALAEPVTTGAGGIWSVVSVSAPTSPAAALEVQPGLVIANDGTSVGSVEGVDLATTMAGSFIGDVGGGGSCEVAGGESQEGPRVAIDVSVRPDAASATDCGPAPPGFVWAGAARGLGEDAAHRSARRRHGVRVVRRGADRGVDPRERADRERRPNRGRFRLLGLHRPSRLECLLPLCVVGQPDRHPKQGQHPGCRHRERTGRPRVSERGDARPDRSRPRIGVVRSRRGRHHGDVGRTTGRPTAVATTRPCRFPRPI